MRSPTERSLAYLRSIGYIPRVVEEFKHFPPKVEPKKPLTGGRPMKRAFNGVRRDLWGCDILAVAPDAAPLLVQTTEQSNVSHRRKKLTAYVELPLWISGGGVVQLHGWDGSDRLTVQTGFRSEGAGILQFTGAVVYRYSRVAKRWVCEVAPHA